MMLTLIVAFALGGAAVYATYRDQKLGTAIVVGLTAITVFLLLMEKEPPAMPQTVAPSTLTPTPASIQPGPHTL